MGRMADIEGEPDAMGPWTPDTEPASAGGDAVTLVEGSSFAVGAPNGDLGGAGPHGVFFRDTRILSRWDLRVDGERAEPLGAMTPEPYRATFLGRLLRRSGRTTTNLLVRRERRVGDGLREDVVLDNPGREPVPCTVTVAVAADFADLFEVKAGTAGPAELSVRAEGERLFLDRHWQGSSRGVVVEAPGATQVVPGGPDGGGVIRYAVVVPPRGTWRASLLVRPVLDGTAIESPFPLDRPLSGSLPALRLRQWQERAPRITSGSEGLEMVLRRSQEDLGALRIVDPEDPATVAVAAGAPWYMALFGRDSLLTSYLAMPVDRGLALGTLRSLARRQGTVTDPGTEEEPGRILHEVRLGVDPGLSLGSGATYYGTADATPLFVVVLGELARWGAPADDLRALLPHADRALEWVQRYGDRDGDGFVEYRRATDRGLINQGWKDSGDGVNFADGSLADAPIALCEVQGYVYDAYRTRAALARQFDDDAGAQRWTEAAAALKQAFNERFWLPDRGWYAIALDRDKNPVDACASNMGHCLWSGIVDDDKAPLVAGHLLSPEMFTGWGVRTLSSAMGAYDPVSYHNGSVWPHDNALVVAGLMRYGFAAEARQIATGLIEAAHAFGGRLPELFCGFDRGEFPEPVPYPTSCSPQAWAAAAPVQLLRSLLGFDPSVPAGELRVAPVLPEAFLPLRIDGLGVGDARLRIDITADGVSVAGVPGNVRLDTGPDRPDRGGRGVPITA